MAVLTGFSKVPVVKNHLIITSGYKTPSQMDIQIRVSLSVSLLFFLPDNLMSFPNQAVLPPGSPGILPERTALFDL